MARRTRLKAPPTVARPAAVNVARLADPAVWITARRLAANRDVHLQVLDPSAVRIVNGRERRSA